MIIKINNFRGDLSSISAKTATLAGSSSHQSTCCNAANHLISLIFSNQHLLIFSAVWTWIGPKMKWLAAYWSVNFFWKLNDFFVGYFDPTNIHFDNRNNNFQGDLSSISAATATLVLINRTHFVSQSVNQGSGVSGLIRVIRSYIGWATECATL